MVRYQCDGCRKLKEDDEVWLLGFAAESIGVAAARREVVIASSWDENRAVEFLAVHFCSEACRMAYMDAMFATAPEALTEEVAVKRKVQRVVPGAVVETVVETSAQRPKKRPAGRKRSR
jgi:hypothetical protein